MLSTNLYFSLDVLGSDPNYKTATNQEKAVDQSIADNSIEDSMMEEPKDFDGDLEIDDIEIVDDDGDYL